MSDARPRSVPATPRTATSHSPASSSTPPTTRSPWPRRRASCRSLTPTSTVRTSWETEDMSAEIVEAVKTLGREKGISEEKLMGALEDALLSAYKKQPGAARYARVRMDRDSGDFIVEEFLLPEDLEDQLLDEAEEQATGALERRVDPETGEVIIPEAPDIDPQRLSEFEDQIEVRDVTPHDFGRIAAQTAKQVILQRIREAERDMMFEEYRDRVGELITGIVQQSDSRYTLVQLRERVEALLPKSEQ